MNKLSIISGGFFLAADIFAIASLVMPNWIVTDIGGSNTKIGLLQTCLKIGGREPVCFTPQTQRGEWNMTFACITLGILCIKVTLILLAVSYWRYRVIYIARWVGFMAMILFCIAAVIFPIAFDMDQIGGKPFQLPLKYQVGISYIFFVLALWITVISELFAGKVCLPHF